MLIVKHFYRLYIFIINVKKKCILYSIDNITIQSKINNLLLQKYTGYYLIDILKIL